MGNITVNWNNLMPPFSTELYRPYNSERTSLQDVEENVVKQTWLYFAAAGYSCTTRLKTVNFNTVKDHIYYCSYMLKPNFELLVSIQFCGGAIAQPITAPANIWSRFSTIGVGVKSGSSYPVYFGNRRGDTSPQEGSYVLLKSPIYIDLTQMFGAGKQPNINEFEAQCALNGIDLTQSYPQDLGSEKTWILPNHSTQLMKRKAQIMTSPLQVINSFNIEISEYSNQYATCNINSYTPNDTLIITPVAPSTSITPVQHYQNGYIVILTPNLIDNIEYTLIADVIIQNNPLDSNIISIAPYGVTANSTLGFIEDGKIKLTFNFIKKANTSKKHIELRTGGKTLNLTNIKFYTNLYEQTLSANTLPQEYERVEYLFRTNEWAGPYSVVNLNLKIGDTLTFKVKGINISGQQAWAGNSTSGENFEFYYQNNSGKISCYPESTRVKNIYSSQSASLDQPDILIGRMLIDGIMTYFGVYRPANYRFNGRIYNFTVRNINGILKHNFIPCYRKLDNVIGFYDLKTNNFYINEVTTGTWQLPSSTN